MRPIENAREKHFCGIVMQPISVRDESIFTSIFSFRVVVVVVVPEIIMDEKDFEGICVGRNAGVAAIPAIATIFPVSTGHRVIIM